MHPAPVIRPARPTDAAQLADLFLQARREAFHWLSPGQFQRADFERQTAGEDVWVAELAPGQLGGFISVWVPDAFVHHLFVAPSCQGQGIGRRLLASLDAWLARPYTLKCMVYNEKALRFYQVQGWQTLGAGGSGAEAYLVLERR